MTPQQLEICLSLGNVKYGFSSWDKRMGISLSLTPDDHDLTAKQDEWMYRLLYKYRKQLPMTYEKYKDNEFCKYKREFKPQTV